MSRTIRRKHLPENFHWCCAKPHLFYTDSYRFCNVPKAFRQQFNQNLRARNKQCLKRGYKFGFEELVFIPHKRTVEWEYY